jgi:hypothetical protein
MGSTKESLNFVEFDLLFVEFDLLSRGVSLK